MTPRTKGRFILLPMLLCVCLILCSCGSNESAEKPSAASSDTAAKDSSPATTAAAGSRDNTPVVLTGSADGTVTYGNDSVTVDALPYAGGLSYGFLLRFQLQSQIADHRF